MTKDYEVALTNLEHYPVRDSDEVAIRGFPIDLPAYFRVVRHMGQVNDHPHGLLGHSLSIDAFTFRSNVTLKFVPGRVMVVLVNGEEVARVAATIDAPDEKSG